MRSQPEAGDAYIDQAVLCRRVVQLLLWMTGYYQGRLDGSWGARSHQALLDLVKLTSENERTDLVQNVGDGLWIFSVSGCISRLLNSHVPIADNPEGEVDMGNATGGFDEQKSSMLEEMENGLAREALPPGFDGQAVEGEEENLHFVRRFFDGIKRLGRRVYYGARTLVVGAIKGLKDIWLYLRDEVVGPATNFFRHVFKQIREGIRSFFDGVRRFVHFVLRKPVISYNENELVFSRFDMDSDCLCYASYPNSSTLLIDHRVLVADLTRQLVIFMRIAGRVIGMIVTLRPPFGWIRLALKIGRIIFEEIRRRVR
jgi:hypothetical protein